MIRIRSQFSHEFTSKETGRRLMTVSEDISSIQEMQDGNAGLCYRGRDGMFPTTTKYEDAVETLFPTAEQSVTDKYFLEGMNSDAANAYYKSRRASNKDDAI